MTNSLVFLNNNFVDNNKAVVSIYDRGFLFADGVYEVIPVYNGKTFALKDHLDRLQNSLNNIKINYNVDYDYWHNVCNKLINTNGQDKPIYIQITRGNEGFRKHDFSKDISPTIVAFSDKPIKLGNCLDNHGIKVILYPDNRWEHCNIKSIALIGNILIRQEGLKQNAEEMLLIKSNNNKNYIVEGTYSNFFIVKNKQVYTPKLNNKLLPGVTRQTVIKICQNNNISITEQDITQEMLFDADEIFLTSSKKELTRVKQIEEKTLENSDLEKSMWYKIANLYIDYIKNNLD